jgi:hypothetical protein
MEDVPRLDRDDAHGYTSNGLGIDPKG